jgi:CheY-like chemotaxis protein
MGQTVLVLAANDLSRRLTVEALELYGHAVLVEDSTDSAAALLKSGRKVSALVVDADHAALAPDADDEALDGLALARLAREIDRRVVVVYTARRPQALPEHRKVRGAPTLRTPFWPHQLTSVLAELRSEPRSLERAA